MVDAERTAAQQRLEEAAGDLREAGIGKVSTAIREGVPGAEIVGLAKQERCDVIVMSTYGRSSLSRVILGSVADYVVHHADDVAVLLVHPGRVIEEAED